MLSTILDLLTSQCFKNLFCHNLPMEMWARWDTGYVGYFERFSLSLDSWWIHCCETHFFPFLIHGHQDYTGWDMLIKQSKFNENVLLEVTPLLSYNLLLLIVTAVSHSRWSTVECMALRSVWMVDLEKCYFFVSRKVSVWQPHKIEDSEGFFIHQLMHKWIVLKTVLKLTLKLTLKQLRHVSVQSRHHQGAHSCLLLLKKNCE